MTDDERQIESAINYFELTKINDDVYLTGREYLKEGMKIGIYMERERSEKLVAALEFYADRDNWDDDITPTVWDNGNVDMGRKAKLAIKEYNGEQNA